MFFLFALVILWSMHGYVAFKLLHPYNLPLSKSIFIYGIAFLFSMLPILPIFLRMTGNESKLLDKISLIGYTSLGFFTLSFVLFIAKDFFNQLLIFSEKFISIIHPVDDSKREFIKKSISIGIFSIAGSASLYGYKQARNGPQIIYQNIYLDKLPLQFDNYRIAQISDLHVGPTIKRPYVEGVVDKISHLNPDMIVVTGDLIDGSVSYLKKDMEPLVDMIAPNGTFFVTGNHEYYSGVDQWLDETNNLGFTNLLNSHQIIKKEDSGIAIAGVTDYRAHQIKSTHKTDPNKALLGISESTLKIVLAHQPASIFKVHEAGADLQLSGHTHGGQFWPFTYPTKWANPYLEGLHNHHGTQIYVNRGTGYWGPPLRIGVPAEITLFQLRKK